MGLEKKVPEEAVKQASELSADDLSQAAGGFSSTEHQTIGPTKTSPIAGESLDTKYTPNVIE